MPKNKKQHYKRAAAEAAAAAAAAAAAQAAEVAAAAAAAAAAQAAPAGPLTPPPLDRFGWYSYVFEEEHKAWLAWQDYLYKEQHYPPMTPDLDEMLSEITLSSEAKPGVGAEASGKDAEASGKAAEASGGAAESEGSVKSDGASTLGSRPSTPDAVVSPDPPSAETISGVEDSEEEELQFYGPEMPPWDEPEPKSLHKPKRTLQNCWVDMKSNAEVNYERARDALVAGGLDGIF